MKSVYFYLMLFVWGATLPQLSRAQVQTLEIPPEKTNPAIKTIHGNHLALLGTNMASGNRLLIMIVGTGGFARDNFSFDSAAVTMGYHVISLDYKNNVITTVCSNSEDSTCFNNFRQEIVFGTNTSSLVEVDSLNSLNSRIRELLQYLSLKYPDKGWSSFIKNGKPNWPKITVAGHSQGAGHAAYLAKKYLLARVILFAGPQDYLTYYNKPANWLSGYSKTPVNRYFAFLHLKDPFDFNKQLANCKKLMQRVQSDTLLINASQNITSRHHILVTNIETDNPHGSMLQVNFEKAWEFLLRK